LILDEPVAALDPLARREFLQGLLDATVEQQLSVVLSSHLVSDLERACDYLIVLVDSRVRVAGEVEELLASHHRPSGPRPDPTRRPPAPPGPAAPAPAPPRRPPPHPVLAPSHADRQTSLIVRADAPIHDPAWTV